MDDGVIIGPYRELPAQRVIGRKANGGALHAAGGLGEAIFNLSYKGSSDLA